MALSCANFRKYTIYVYVYVYDMPEKIKTEKLLF